MYGYNEEGFLTKEQILTYFDQAKVVEKLITGHPIIPYERVFSRFRIDTTPNCYFEWYNGKLWFIDFADKPTHRDIFNMIQDAYKATYTEAIEIIGRHFSMKDFPTPQHTVTKGSSEIQFKSRDFQLRDKDFWFPYGITRTQLIEDKVIPLIWYKFYSSKSERWIVIRPEDVGYVYTEFEDNKVKVYRPYANKKAKWLSNCTVKSIGGIKSVSFSDRLLLITKSYKDWRVLKNAGVEQCVWFPNEGMTPPDEMLVELCTGYETILILFDNDETGLRASEGLADYINELLQEDKVHPIYIPVLTGCKDPAELRKKDETKLIQFLKDNQCVSR